MKDKLETNGLNLQDLYWTLKHAQETKLADGRADVEEVMDSFFSINGLAPKKDFYYLQAQLNGLEPRVNKLLKNDLQQKARMLRLIASMNEVIETLGG